MINAQYFLLFGGLFLIMFDLLRSYLRFDSKVIHLLAFSILLIAFFVELFFGNLNDGFFAVTSFSSFVDAFIILLALLIYSYFYLNHEEFSNIIDILFIFSVLGATLIVLSNNLLALALSIELVAISSFALVFFKKNDLRLEGLVKYISMSFISVSIILFGISLIYIETGTLSFEKISIMNPYQFVIGIIVLLVGLSYEATLVPFHMWAIDTYDASDNAITAFLIVIKASVLVAILKVFFYAVPYASSMVRAVLLFLVFATIFIPSLFAISQDKIKRLLVYSSIAQAGFSFAAISMLTQTAINGAVFYIFAFVVSEVLIFLSFDEFESNGITSIENLYKIKKSSKFYAFSFIVGLLSLAGVPPFIGFFGKFVIFYSLLSAGYLWLAIALIFLLLFSTFYYFKPIIKVFNSSEFLLFKRKYLLKNLLKDSIIFTLLLIVLFGSIFLIL